MSDPFEGIVKFLKWGRVIIPKKVRKKLGWVEGKTFLKLFIEGNKVILEPIEIPELKEETKEE